MSGHTESTGRTTAWALVFIVLLGLAFRAPRLIESLWYDEIAAWMYCGQPGPAAITGTYADPANHIAHTLLTWCSVTAFEDTLGAEVTLRLPALVFSLLSIGAVFLMAQRAAGRRVGLIAAALAATAPVAVLEGVEARGYSMMIFFAAATTWQMRSGLETRRTRHWVAYAILCAAGIWAHLMTVFVPVGHAAWLAWGLGRGRGRRQEQQSPRGPTRRAALGGVAAIAVAAALTLALYAPVLDDIVRTGEQVRPASGDERSLLGAEGRHALLQLGGSWYWWAALPGLALAAVGAMRALRDACEQTDGRMRATVALSLLCLPVMVAAVLLAGTWIYARFTLFALPGAMLLMAIGLDTVWTWRRRAGVAASVVLAVAFVADLAVRPPKQPLREAAALVHAERSDGDRTLVIGIFHEVFAVYDSGLDVAYSPNHGADLERHLEATNPAWVIVMYPESVPASRYDLLARHGFEQTARFDGWVDWTNGDVLVLRKR